MSRGATKTCATCGRTFAWRKRWERCWSQVVHCSAGCRGSRPSAIDRELEHAILGLLGARSRTSSVCPSEVARSVRPDDWRAWMQATRAAARRLAALGVVQVTQRGRVVDATTARGAIRLRLAHPRHPA